MTRLSLFFLIFWLFISGCSNKTEPLDKPELAKTQATVSPELGKVSAQNYLRIKQKMQMDEVKLILGSPHEKDEENPTYKVWYWKGENDAFIRIGFQEGFVANKHSENLK